MAAIHLTLEGEEATFFWKDGKAYTEGYDLESEKAVLALTGFGKGIGVLLVALNDCCKSETELIFEIKKFVAEYNMILANKYGYWLPGHLLFEYYSYSSDPKVRWKGLDGARLSEKHYKRMFKDPEMPIKEMMARLPQLPEKYFYPLASLSNSDVNYCLAQNENCPSDVLEILAKDEDEEVRRCVAENQKCSAGVLELLTQDDDATIRWRVALNPKCPARILEMLARDEAEEVRQSVLYNPSCPKRIMEIIAKDQDQETKEYAQEQLRKLQGFEI